MPIFIFSLEFRSSPPLAPPSLQNQNSKSTSKDDSLGTSSVGGGRFTRQIPRARPARLRRSRLRMSPILASSLGLNRIKMRSGPLLHESLFGFRGDKGSALA
ncbi:unnamed protein product [Malus baccata var. baccata]